MGSNSNQRSWDRRYCPNCQRGRIHLRIGTKQVCIGQLKDRKSASDCGPRDSIVLPTPIIESTDVT